MKKVYESSKAEFFRDSTTEYWNRELRKVDSRGVSLGDHFCLIAVSKKDGCREFVVFDGKGCPMFAASNPYDMDFEMTLYRMEVAHSLDIRNIAKTREVPRVM